MLNPWVGVVGLIAHEHGDVKFVHYAFDLYPVDSNHMIGFMQGFYVIWRNCHPILQDSYFKIWGQHLYMKQCWMEKMYACICCRSHLVHI